MHSEMIKCWGLTQDGTTRHLTPQVYNRGHGRLGPNQERIRQYDSSDTGHSDNVNIAAEHQEPAEVLSQLDNTSNSPVYGEYKCC